MKCPICNRELYFDYYYNKAYCKNYLDVNYYHYSADLVFGECFSFKEDENYYHFRRTFNGFYFTIDYKDWTLLGDNMKFPFEKFNTLDKIKKILVLV